MKVFFKHFIERHKGKMILEYHLYGFSKNYLRDSSKTPLMIKE